jgi:murein L,D-transpeptidase YcbB/YkuD
MFLKSTPFIKLFLVIFILFGCNTEKNKSVSKSNLSGFQKELSGSIKSQIEIDSNTFVVLNNIVFLDYFSATKSVYKKNDFHPIWIESDSLNPKSIEFVHFLDTAIYVGLNKNDYQFDCLRNIVSLYNHKFTNPKAAFFAKADILFTNAFLHVIKDLKQGRIIPDSLSWKENANKQNDFFIPNIDEYFVSKNANFFFKSIQPKWKPYSDLVSELHEFVNKMDTQQFTYLNYPYNKSQPLDSAYFVKQLIKRFAESNYLLLDTVKHIDSLGLASLVSNYQKTNHLEVDGKIGRQIIGHLNLTDKLKLKRIMLSLDRYKLESDSLPEAFVWVNLPAYKLEAWKSDSIQFLSKIVCGRPYTPTPVLKSNISEMVLYPTWTVPVSIIKKEILPGLKRNNNYLARKGLHLEDHKGNRVNPNEVDWGYFKKGIPYKVRQSSGDRNALGVIKFNFKNSFDVYLHDTNLRSLFKNSNRALSHGCVRVERFDQLAKFVAQFDSSRYEISDTLKYTSDSINSWLAAKKRKRIAVRNEMPLFINYITCEAKNGEIVFHEDIYDSDRKMIEMYFNSK